MGKNKEKAPEYAVERIVNHRFAKQTHGSVTFQSIEIHVKWEGYAASHNTWEPLTSIYFDVKALIRRYFREKGWELNCEFKFILTRFRRHERATLAPVHISAARLIWKISRS